MLLHQKKIYAFSILLFSCWHYLIAQTSLDTEETPTVDSVQVIHQLHLQTIGGITNLRALQAIKIEPRKYPEYLGQTTIIIQKPYFSRVETVLTKGDTVITCDYPDSTLIWSTTLVRKTMTTQKAWEKIRKKPIQSTNLITFKEHKHFYNSFVEYVERNYFAEYLGKICLEGKTYFKILIRQNQGVKAYYYINAQSYLIDTEEIHILGRDFISKRSFSDYRPVANVLLPFSMVQDDGGSKMYRVYEKIETVPFSADLYRCKE